MTSAARPYPRSGREVGAASAVEGEVRRRLAFASVQLVALRCELDQLQADLAWLQVTAAGGPDLGEDLL